MSAESSLSAEIFKVALSLGIAGAMAFFVFMLIVVARIVWRSVFEEEVDRE